MGSRRRSKKKDQPKLSELKRRAVVEAPSTDRLNPFSRDIEWDQTAPAFMTPEDFVLAGGGGFSEWQGFRGQEGRGPAIFSDWDVAVHLAELKRRGAKSAEEQDRLKTIAAEAVIRRAMNLLGSAGHPTQMKWGEWEDIPSEATQVEWDLEATMDENAQGGTALIYSYSLRRKRKLNLLLDTSLSMTGEKLAQAAVALAVVLLQFPSDPIGVIAFEHAPTVLKDPEEVLTMVEVIRRFLSQPTEGYTHLEAAVRAGLALERTLERVNPFGPVSTLLITDGKTTAGRDPRAWAQQFQSLNVVKMGRDQSSEALCYDLAHRGRGVLEKVASYEELPRAMMSIVERLLRPSGLQRT